MQDTSKTLQLIADNTEVVVKLPWNGVYGWYRILILNSTQLQACGAFTLIQLADSEKLSEEESIDALLELKNAQERMFRMALVEPTFEQILEVYKATDAWASVLEKERVVKEALTGMEMSEEKVELEQEFHLLQMFKGFVFPDDFASALTENQVIESIAEQAARAAGPVSTLNYFTKGLSRLSSRLKAPPLTPIEGGQDVQPPRQTYAERRSRAASDALHRRIALATGGE